MRLTVQQREAGARFLGMHFNQADTPWPALVPRIGSVRIWDADRTPGVGRARRAVAPWPGNGPGQCGEPATDAARQDWVRSVVTRYRGQARAVVRQVDPSALVVSPAISGFDGPGWLDLFVAQGGGAHVDVVAMHGHVDRPEDLWHKAALTRLLLARWGLQGKPSWNIGQGWLDAQAPPDLPPPAEGAAWISRTQLVNWAWGIGRLAFYTGDNGASRVPRTGPDRRPLTEAGIAWQQTAAWMAGRQLTAVLLDAAGTWIYTLRQPDRSGRWLLWNPDTVVAFLPPAAWNVRSRADWQGRRRAPAVGGAPQLLGP